jgi:hypothetical protein
MLAMRKHVKSDGNVHNMYVDFENTQIPVTHISEIRVLAPPWFVHTGRMEPNLYIIKLIEFQKSGAFVTLSH